MTNNFTHWKRKFALIYAGQMFSILTSSAVNFAMILWLTMSTGSAQVLAYATIAGLLPGAIIGPFAGVFIDRWNKKYTMMFADAFVAIATLIMAIILIQGSENLIFIYIMMALRSLAGAFHYPAMQASTPLLAPKEEYMRVAGAGQVIQSLSSIAGPALGGLAISIFPIGQVLLLDIFGAIMANIFLAFVSFPKQNTIKNPINFQKVIQELKEGLDAILENRGLTWFFGYGIIAMLFLMPVVTILPLMTQNHFGGKEFELSVIEIAFAIGALVGGIIVTIHKFKVHKIFLINTLLIIAGLLFGISGFLPTNTFWIFATLMTALGITASFHQSAFMAFLQEKIAPEKLGRVMSLNFSISALPSIIGLVGIGVITDIIGITQMFIILGGLIALLGIVQFLTPAIQEMMNEK